MGQRTCQSCSTKCYLLTLTCLYDGLTYLHSGLDPKKVKAAMDVAQLTWVKPLIKADCFAALCAAIADYEDNDVPVPDIWQDMLDNVAELVRTATDYHYLIRGGVTVAKEGVQLPEIKNWSQFVASLKAAVVEQQGIFSAWLDDNRTTYSCLPAPTCCDTEPESPFLGSWGTVSPNPQVRRDPPYQELY